MTARIVFIERQKQAGVSIERVFRQIVKKLPNKKFDFLFEQMPFGNSAIGTLKNLVFYRKKTADIYHITGQIHYIALLLPKNKTVLTVHDAGILLIRGGFRRFVLKKLFFDLPFKKLKYITAVSEKTKNEIIFYTACPPEKIRVIENPLAENFTPVGKREKEFNAVCPTILQIGTMPNKNLERLIEAAAGIECRLRIIGNLAEDLKIKMENLAVKFSNAENLNDDEIKKEYENADLLAFCSTYEGFGLPLIEAQATGLPVITGRISPLQEVSGGAAALVDPFDVSAIRRAIQKIIADEKYRCELVLAGLKNVEKFDARRIAAEYEKLYGEILDAER